MFEDSSQVDFFLHLVLMDLYPGSFAKLSFSICKYTHFCAECIVRDGAHYLICSSLINQITDRTQFLDLDRQKGNILVNSTQVYVISGLNWVLFVILMLLI